MTAKRSFIAMVIMMCFMSQRLRAKIDAYICLSLQG